MTAGAVPAPVTATRTVADRLVPRWHLVVLTAILAVAAFLDFFRLNRNGYANEYYAGAVRSMLKSWHNFFFVSFDPGGLVSVDTVTAQLLYEIGGPAYLNPDVTARFDSIRLAAEGPDRVRISGVRGDSPPDTAKVALNSRASPGFSSVSMYSPTGSTLTSTG